MLNTVKKQAWWCGVWVTWDIGFFIKNLIEGDFFTMLFFAVLGCVQVLVFLHTRKLTRKRLALEAEIKNASVQLNDFRSIR